MAALALALLVGLVISYLERSRQVEAVRSDVYEVLISVFQDKLGDTLDRISLIAPDEEDKTTVKKLNDMRKHLSKLNISSAKLDALSQLTQALNLLVNKGKYIEEAGNPTDPSDLLEASSLPESEDRFVSSRALLLQAAALFSPDSVCDQPKAIMDLVEEAIRRDASAVAAFNLRGICRAKESENLMADDKWEESANQIHQSLEDTEFAYQLKPSQGTKIRSLNNKAWNSMQFLKASLDKTQDLTKSLQQVGEYESMDDFFEKSLKDLIKCQTQSHENPLYFETEAELHAFECIYYKKACEKILSVLEVALNKGLLRVRGKNNTMEEAGKYFKGDIFLKPFLFDNEGKMYPHIEKLILSSR